jgi:hypothetical protein
MGIIGNSPYNNPQMGSYGGTTGAMMGGGGNPYGQSGVPQGSFGGPPDPYGMSPADASWYGSQVGPGGLWQDYGEVPGGFGGSSWWNPATGQQVTQSGDVIVGYYGDSNAIRSTNPYTGETYINPDALMGPQGALGAKSGGGADYQGFTPSDFAGGQITPPDAYGGGNWDMGAMVDPSAVIEAYRPTMEANIGQGFAEAGNRLGASGFAMSTPYATALGDVERLARAQMNQRGLEYSYNAAEQQRAREMQTMMAQNAEMFGAWQQGGNWDMGAQGQNAQNAYNQWLAENQWGFQGNQQQNLFNQQNAMNQQNQQQQMLASLLGGLL